VRPPRVLDPRNWQTFTPADDPAPANGPAKPDAPTTSGEQDNSSRNRS
jgi:hypothetical protein